MGGMGWLRVVLLWLWVVLLLLQLLVLLVLWLVRRRLLLVGERVVVGIVGTYACHGRWFSGVAYVESWMKE